ncbi:MAG TPA: hypothetical protein VJN68_01065 [Burkholderiaceae bacterium]|nr:hypothetical protein [Burkholderiaceae bacterium]
MGGEGFEPSTAKARRALAAIGAISVRLSGCLLALFRTKKRRCPAWQTFDRRRAPRGPGPALLVWRYLIKPENKADTERRAAMAGEKLKQDYSDRAI